MMTLLSVCQIILDAGLVVVFGIYAYLLWQQLSFKDTEIETQNAHIKFLESQAEAGKEWESSSLARKYREVKDVAEIIASENLQLQRKLNQELSSPTRDESFGYASGLIEAVAALGLIETQITREIQIEGHTVPSPAFMNTIDELCSEIVRAVRANISGKPTHIDISKRYKDDSHRLKEDLARNGKAEIINEWHPD